MVVMDVADMEEGMGDVSVLNLLRFSVSHFLLVN